MKDYKVLKQPLPNGETMAYRKSGTGEKILFLIHGNQSSSVFFNRTIERFEKEATVYAIDMIGFGDSTYNKGKNSLKDFAVDVDLFMDAMGIKGATVLGWSTGGGVAMELAAMSPEKVKSIILLDSVGLKGYNMYKYDEEFKPILSERVHLREDIEKDPVSVLPVLAAFESSNREFLKQVWNAIIFNLHQPPEEEYEKYLDGIMKQRCLVDVVYSLANFNITHDNNGAVDGSGIIDKIKCPVYIIHGEKDMVVSVELAKEAKNYFKDQAELNIIKDAGHSALYDKEEEYFEILERVLNA